jgi:AmpE protein
MKFLVLLVVLALRRLELNWPEWLLAEGRVGQVLSCWWQRLSTTNRGWHWVLAVLLPALLLGWIFYWLEQPLLGLLAWLAGGLLLLWLWGGHSEFRQVEDLLACGRRGEWTRFEEMADEQFQVKRGEEFLDRLEQAFLLRDAKVLFASIFWLVLLGYWAVFLYLANQVYLVHYSEDVNPVAERLQQIMLYPVARLLAVCMALTSDFKSVMSAVGDQLVSGSNEELLGLAACGALAHCREKEKGDETNRVERLAVLHAVMLRSLALWLVIAALWVMLFY